MASLAELIVALGLPFAPQYAASPACPAHHAPYRLNWTANSVHERNMSGLPTMAFATSPQGPALPVDLVFGGPAHAFDFDSPKVSGQGSGELSLHQQLRFHDEFTRTEIIFNRHVVNLRMKIEDLDQRTTFNGAYSDTITIGGANRFSDMAVEPFISRDGSSRAEDRARRELRQRLGREDRLEVSPIGTGAFGRQNFSTLEAMFDQPVYYVKMTFGSNPDIFPVGHFSQSPGAQSIRVTDLTFCVAFGSRVGD